MRFRKLRIAWSIGCAIVSVLLIVFWVRSHYWVDQVFLPITQSAYVTLGSTPDAFGVGLTDSSPNGAFGTFHMPVTDWLAAVSDGTSNSWSGVMMFSISADGAILPYWFGVLMSAAFGTAPWLPCRFRLRTLLIGTTLVAVVLGLIVWLW